MFHNQNTKTISLAPASYTNGATAALVVDTKGFGAAQFVVTPGSGGAATNAISVLKIEEGDTTSSFSNVTGYVGGTNAAGGFTIPANIATAATSAQPYVLNVDLLGRKRYLKLSVSPSTTQVIGAVVSLGRAAVAPDKLSEAIAAGGADGTQVAGSTTLGLCVNAGGALA